MASTKKALSTADAKSQVVDLIAGGSSIVAAMAAVGRTAKTYANWRYNDDSFAARVDEARRGLAEAKRRGLDVGDNRMSFADWRRTYLGVETFPHQQNWVDLLEGNEPSWMHPSMTYTPGDRGMLLINTPPNHAKSMTVTIDWVTYQVCMNPATSIIQVSKTQQMAQDFLYAVKQRLTSPRYALLQNAYGGPNGFKDTDGSWTANRIYLDSSLRNTGEKDPTVQAIGMGGQIYGARANIIVVDDAVVLANAGEFEKQIRWLIQEVASRLPGVGGKLLVIGTRVAPTDLYSELQNPDRYVTGRSPWTYLGMPAVLEFAEHPKDWVTLWPKADAPFLGDDVTEPDEQGLYPRWDGLALDRIRNKIPAKVWALTYQQAGVDDEATFPAVSVMGCVNRRRKPGPLKAGAWGHPRNGQEGMHVVMSVDPAGTGEAFVLLYAVDRPTEKRYVLECWCATNTTPAWYADLLEQVSDEYNVRTLVIEQNAYASWLIHDQRIKSYCASHGIRMVPHYTGRNKQDPDFGVPSLSPLLGTTRRINDGAGRIVHNDDGLVEFPDPDKSYGVRMLVEQLISWQPGKLGRQLRQDGPMAWWFAELVTRNYLGQAQHRRSHIDNPYLSRSDKRKRIVISADAYRQVFA